jgi:hypothetical protein
MRLARWILASGLILAAAPLFAQTVAVGTCQPNKTSFPKIQQALNATPPGATIDVCPGLYPEQILVYQAVTLKGIASGNQGAAWRFGAERDEPGYRRGHRSANTGAERNRRHRHVLGDTDPILCNVR